MIGIQLICLIGIIFSTYLPFLVLQFFANNKALVYAIMSIFRPCYSVFWAILIYFFIKDGRKEVESRNSYLFINYFLSLPLFRPISKLSYQLYLIHCIFLTVGNYMPEDPAAYNTCSQFVSGKSALYFANRN